jgi:hypothetical protein
MNLTNDNFSFACHCARRSQNEFKIGWDEERKAPRSHKTGCSFTPTVSSGSVLGDVGYQGGGKRAENADKSID